MRKNGKSRKTRYAKEIDKAISKPELISKYMQKDALCRKTFEIFRAAYSRFAKGCALDSLPFGGVYITGGIALKNPSVFGKEFIKEFEDIKNLNSEDRKQLNLIKSNLKL